MISTKLAEKALQWNPFNVPNFKIKVTDDLNTLLHSFGYKGPIIMGKYMFMENRTIHFTNDELSFRKATLQEVKIVNHIELTTKDLVLYQFEDLLYNLKALIVVIPSMNDFPYMPDIDGRVTYLEERVYKLEEILKNMYNGLNLAFGKVHNE